jgi:tRNA 5-methylaminomethyl-2-thiouridine biosynthesis bifunctional protein
VTELPKDHPVVLAFGNGSPIFKETSWLPLRPLRGQTSYVESTAESRALKTIVCHEGHISPEWMGVHVAGATFQKEPVAMPDLREADHAENLGKVNKNLPALHLSKVVGGRAGYRATTPDHLPLVGACPDHEAFLRGETKYIDNLYIAAGLGSHGLSGGPLVGEIIASLIAGDPAPVPAHLLPYLAPERFILRERKRGRV